MATRDRAPTALPIATAITLLAALLRFLYLGHDSLWFDEVLTRGTAVASLASPAAALAMRDHVPLLYWLTALVLRVLPEHEVTLRLVSALAGVLAVPLLLALALPHPLFAGSPPLRPAALLLAAGALLALPGHGRGRVRRQAGGAYLAGLCRRDRGQSADPL
jgi:predicted membrane-bound mannosyltransferase